MKNRLINHIVLGALVANLTITYIPTQATQPPKTTRKQLEKKIKTLKKRPKKLTQQEINKKIADLKKVMRKIKGLKIAIAAALAGGGVVAATLSITAGLLLISIGAVVTLPVIVATAGVIIPTSLAVGYLTLPFAGTTAAATIETAKVVLFSQLLLFAFGTGSTILGGIVGASGILGALGTLAGFSAASLLVAAKTTDKLLEQEKYYPGILTTNQKKTIAQFKKQEKESTVRGLLRGIRFKEAVNNTIDSIKEKNKTLIANLGGGKKAREILKKYILSRWQLRNFEATKKIYKQAIAQQKTKRNKHKKSTLAYHLANLKLITIKTSPKHLLIKIKLKSMKKKVAKLETKYPQLKNLVKTAVQSFIQQADQIIAELQK